MYVVLSSLLALAGPAVPSPTPTPGPKVDPVDDAIARARTQHQRELDDITLTVMSRTKKTWDSVKGLPVLGYIDGALGIADSVVILASGKTIYEATEDEVRSRTRESVYAALTESVGSDLTRGTWTRESASDLDKRLKITSRLDESLRRRADLSADERDALQTYWRQLTSSNAVLMRDEVVATRKTLRAAMDEQHRTAKELAKLGKKAVALEEKVDTLTKAMKKLEDSSRSVRQIPWDRVGFDEKVKLARACDAEPGPQCAGLSDDQKTALLVRGEIRDAALDVASFTSTYLRGGLEVAQNLGVEVPAWASKAVSGATAGSTLVAGIASGNPQAILTGLVGVSSLFRKAKPSPEMQALARIEQQLQQVHARLTEMDKKLDRILAGQAEILREVVAVSEKLDLVRDQLQTLIARSDARYTEQIRKCGLVRFTDDELGPWAGRFDPLLAGTSAARRSLPNSLSALPSRPDERRDIEAKCVEFVYATLSPEPADEAFHTVATHAAHDPEANAVRREKLDRARIEAHLELAQVETLGWLVLALPRTETERALGLIRGASARRTYEEIDAGGYRDRQLWRRLDLSRISTMAALAATFFRREALQERAVALLGAAAIVEKWLIQTAVLDETALTAVPAVALIDGRDPTKIGALIDGELNAIHADRRHAYARRVLGDLIDANLWLASADTASFRVSRRTILNAWRLGSVEVLARLIQSAGALATWAEVGASDRTEVCLRPGSIASAELAKLGSICIGEADFEARATEAQEDQGTSSYARLLLQQIELELSVLRAEPGN